MGYFTNQDGEPINAKWAHLGARWVEEDCDYLGRLSADIEAGGGIDSIDPDFTIGDVVSLIVGGPDMVVVDVCEDCGSIEVVWVQPDGFVMRDAFPEEALIEVV